jgi:hypothetical protein
LSDQLFRGSLVTKSGLRENVESAWKLIVPPVGSVRNTSAASEIVVARLMVMPEM